MIVLFVLLGVLLLVSVILMVVWNRKTKESENVEEIKINRLDLEKTASRVNTVVNLNSDIELHRFLLQPQKALVMIYSMDCENCKLMHPIMKTFAQKHPECVFGQIDWKNCESTCERHHVEAFPTLMTNGYKQFLGFHGLEDLEELLMA